MSNEFPSMKTPSEEYDALRTQVAALTNELKYEKMSTEVEKRCSRKN